MLPIAVVAPWRRAVDIWGPERLSAVLSVSKDHLKKCMASSVAPTAEREWNALVQQGQWLPAAPALNHPPAFRFVDLFAGIGALRTGFSKQGGECVFTSEWNAFARRTYQANHECGESHIWNHDIRDATWTQRVDVDVEDAYRHVDRAIPNHDVLLAGFPCQPFSVAGVSKKNSLGRKHGFEDATQGTLFFDVARVLHVKRPMACVLENVKNLRSHDKGKTFAVILQTLDELGYTVVDAAAVGKTDPKIIDARHWVPQHRERVVLVGLRKDLDWPQRMTLADVVRPVAPVTLPEILDDPVDAKYIITPKLWDYLVRYAEKHRKAGNGFGFGLVDPQNPASVTRTLSARYYKDGSEILLDRGWNMDWGYPSQATEAQLRHRPRRLTPRECARLMGLESPGQSEWKIPVSDVQAYKQFGNAVAAPVFEAVAQWLIPKVIALKS